MKKILALAMALVMMMAVAVPAFAEELNSNVNTGDTTVIVDGTNGGELKDGNYTVTIPATVNLTWGNDGADEYSVTSQLVTGKRVKVELAKSVDLTNAAGKTIAFTATDATDGLSASEVVNDEVHAFDITVASTAWTAVPFDVYEGQISFTASVVDA